MMKTENAEKGGCLQRDSVEHKNKRKTCTQGIL